MEIKWEIESEIALKAVSKASELITGILDTTKIDFKGDHKDIVTEYDIACEKIIFDALSESRYPCVGEESLGKIDLDQNFKTSTTWFVDPIDGTTNFASGMPFYAISVGLISRSEFVAGAVSIPSQRELFFTYGSNGSYQNGKRLRINNRNLKSSSIAASFSNAKIFKEQRQAEYRLFGMVNEAARTNLRLGSAATNICYVACNRLHVAYGFNAQMWDIAGSLAVAAQAGCKILLEVNAQTSGVNYIVGAQTATEELYALFKSEGFFNE